MRVAYVCADRGIPVFGRKGSSVHVQEVMRALVRCGAQIDLFAARVDGEPPAGLETVRLHKLPTVPKVDTARREKLSLAANDDLRAALEREGPFDMVYERYSLWSHAGMEYARATGTPGLLEVNAPLIEEQDTYRSLVDRASAEQVAERVFSAASALIAVSAELAVYLKQQYPSVQRSVHVVPNGVNPERFPPNVPPTRPAPVGMFTVGFVGSLKRWHGVPILVEAFDTLHRREPRTRLLIVGDGPERETIAADVITRGLQETVHFTGAVSPDEIPGWLASMDIAVAPYPRLERFYYSPLKMYEYMAAGLPVVASRIGQMNTLIEDRVNGLLCAPGDARALAAALEQLRCDPPLRVRLGEAARTKVLREHTWDAVARRILQLAGQANAARMVSMEART